MRRATRLYACALLALSLVFAPALMAVTTANAVPAAPTSSVALPYTGQQFTLSGDIGTSIVRTVELQTFASSTWSKYASGKTFASGTYAFPKVTSTAPTRRFRVVAKTDKKVPGATTTLTSGEVIITTQPDAVSIFVSRTGNTGKASGFAIPVIENRAFTLQYKNGTKWVPVGNKVKESAEGNVRAAFPLAGAKSYRFIGDPVPGSAGPTSTAAAFNPGPKTIGPHVIYVTTDSGVTPIKKGVNYPGTAIIDGGDPLALETIALRGNTTATKDKKPYKLKFVDKQKPFNLKSDRTWILLANYLDRSLVRSKVAWDLGAKLTGLTWTPSSEFTELVLNGKYLGSYQLVQSVKIDSDRVNVSKATGQIIEFDPHWLVDDVRGFIGRSGVNYSWKDPDEFKPVGDGFDPGGLTDAKVASMRTKVENFEKVLYGADNTLDWSTIDVNSIPAVDDWMTYLDLDSAVDYYLAREFTKDNDADMFRSNFFYTNNVDPNSGDKFFMGPIWDFDRSAGAQVPGPNSVDSPTGWWMRGKGSPDHDTNSIHWFTRITKDPRFLARLETRWAATRQFYQAVGDSSVDSAVARVGVAAANDWALWGTHTFGRPTPHATTYGGEVGFVKAWYHDRFVWMDSRLTPAATPGS